MTSFIVQILSNSKKNHYVYWCLYCIQFFNQEFAPSDEEFAALRAGEEWDPEKAARLKADAKVFLSESYSKQKC